MGTTKQKKLAKIIVENSTVDKPLNQGQMLGKVGYAENTIEAKSGEIIGSEGVKEELQILGFTEENAMKVVSEIMLNPEAQDNNRLKASEQVFKVRGSYAPEKKLNVNLNTDLPQSKEAQALAEKYEQELKDTL